MLVSKLTQRESEAHHLGSDSDSFLNSNSSSPRPFDLVSRNLQGLGALSVDTFLFAPFGSDYDIGLDVHVPYHALDLQDSKDLPLIHQSQSHPHPPTPSSPSPPSPSSPRPPAPSTSASASASAPSSSAQSQLPTLPPPAGASLAGPTELQLLDDTRNLLPARMDRLPSYLDPNVKMHNVARLHQTCQSVFGTSHALNFEFVEEDGPNSKQCILTITRPNGAVRSYKTEPEFLRKNEAKSRVAAIALEMGALAFIVSGDSDAAKAKRGMLLAPLDVSDPSNQAGSVERANASPSADSDASVKEIEDCCLEWRGGAVKPHWYSLSDPKLSKKRGFALRIKLTAYSLRVYSSDTIYDNVIQAKKACAKIALEQGVLDYIKYGNGQTQPSAPVEPLEDENARRSLSPLPSVLSLQAFYEALPRPFPEPFGDKTASEINAPAWLNTAVQGARGGKLRACFIWINDGGLGLHGCLLRVDRSGENRESRSYLVDPHFPKRADAKAAVCLLAMSQGLGGYIRAVGAAAEKELTPDVRKLASEQIFPALAAECYRVQPGAHPTFEYSRDRDAFGCTLKMDVSLFTSKNETREYCAPPKYRNKADAKAAAVYMAAQEGLLELLRFRGEPPPPGYTPFWAAPSDNVISDQRSSVKRKEPDSEDFEEGQAEVQDRKRRKKGNKGGRNSQAARPEDAVASRSSHSLPRRPPDTSNGNGDRIGNNGGSWKKPHVSGSGGLGSIRSSAQTGESIGQYRPESRDVGDSTSTRNGALEVGQAATPIPQGPRANRQRYVPKRDERYGRAGDQTVPHQFAPHAAPEPFAGSSNLNAQAHGNVAGGVQVYPPSPSPYAGPHLALPPGTIPSQPPYGGYQLPTFQQQYTHPGSAVNYPPQAQVVYAAGPSSAVAPFPPTNVYHPANYPPDFGRTHSQPYIPPAFPVQRRASDSLEGNPRPPRGPRIRDRPSAKKMRPSDHRRGNHREGLSKRPRGPQFRSQDGPRSEGKHEPPNIEPLARVGTVSSPRSEAKMSTESRAKDHIPQPVVSDTSQQHPKNDAKDKVSASSRSHVAALLNHCSKENMPRPRFHDESFDDKSTGARHKVWVILGSERLELPVTFASVSEGQERVAKQVLNRLRSQGKKHNQGPDP